VRTGASAQYKAVKPAVSKVDRVLSFSQYGGRTPGRHVPTCWRSIVRSTLKGSAPRPGDSGPELTLTANCGLH